MPTRPVPTGLFLGLLLTIALTGVLSVGERLAGLPFLPFDLFDWVARRLPGPLLTAGIDALVSLISLIGIGPTSDLAKLAEQTMAIVAFVAGGAIGGGLLAVLRERLRGEARTINYGLALGMLVGVPAAVVSGVVGAASLPAPVGMAWIIGLFLAWGALLGWAYDRVRLQGRESAGGIAGVEAIDRRRFLVRLGGAAAVMTVAGAVVRPLRARGGARSAALSAGAQPWSAGNPLPNANDPVEPVRGTRPEFTPVAQHYRIDINTRPVIVEGESWRLAVSGLVERPLELSLADLRGFEPTHQFVTLSCISNRVGGDLISTTRWTGVSLQRLLPNFRLRDDATHLRLRSADGFHEVLALELVRADPRVMLCYDWDGLPLPEGHGFPLRLYVPDLYGMKQPKWIVTVEAIDRWEEGYWVERGWDRDARVEATAVIDTVATDMMMGGMAASGSIPIGGIAYAGARGISRVEVRIDDEPWNQARIRQPLSDTTWVVWRYDWPFRPGEHDVAVRCFDGDGRPQTVEPSPTHPDGATGLHTSSFMV
jgi:DMSO/TMAO reductase YedYZ molybdopterin-dependent catalytic subunit